MRIECPLTRRVSGGSLPENKMKRKMPNIQDESRFIGKVTGLKMQSKGKQTNGLAKFNQILSQGLLFPTPPLPHYPITPILHHPIIPTIQPCKLKNSLTVLFFVLIIRAKKGKIINPRKHMKASIRHNRDQQRLLKFISLLILFPLIIPSNLFPWISSRVEGTIVDEETGQPIVGAYVGIFHCFIQGNNLSYSLMPPNDKSGSKYISTNDNGYFRFDDLNEAEYFLAVFKEGYAAVGPFYYKKPDLFEENTGSAETSQIERFLLKEGQIKHFKIQMEKEAILKVNVLRKTFEGIEPIDEFDITVQHSDFLEEFEANIKPGSNNNPYLKKIKRVIPGGFKKKYIPTDEGFQTIYFKKGTVSIEISPNGYSHRTFEGIQLVKGKVELVEWIVDFTEAPVVYGVIKNKYTGEPFPVIYLDFEKQDEPNKYFYIKSYPDNNGKFWIGGMSPGKYLFHIYSFGGGGDKKIDFEVILNITLDSIIEVNKEF